MTEASRRRGWRATGNGVGAGHSGQGKATSGFRLPYAGATAERGPCVTHITFRLCVYRRRRPHAAGRGWEGRWAEDTIITTGRIVWCTTLTHSLALPKLRSFPQSGANFHVRGRENTVSFDVTSSLHTRDNPERLREHSQGEGMDERPLPVTAMATLALDGTSDGDSGMWGTAPPEGAARAPALLAFLLTHRLLRRCTWILAEHYRLRCKQRPTGRVQGRPGQRLSDTGRDGVHGWLGAGRGGAVIQADSCASPLWPGASPSPHRRCHITLHSLPSTHTAPGCSPARPPAAP